MDVDTASLMITKTNAVLVGWTTNEEASRTVQTEEKAVNDLLASSVTITKAGTNEKVYALWAADGNGNHIRDYLETKLRHLYYENTDLVESGSSTIPASLTVAGAAYTPQSNLTIVETDEDGDMQKTENGKFTARTDIETWKSSVANYNVAPETDVVIEAPEFRRAVLYADDGETVLNKYTQVGWSGFPHQAIGTTTGTSYAVTYPDPYDSGAAYDETTGRYTTANSFWEEAENGAYSFTKDNETEKFTFHRVIRSDIYQNAYALWILDNNQNGIPDNDEAKAAIVYNYGDDAVAPDSLIVAQAERYVPGIEDQRLWKSDTP